MARLNNSFNPGFVLRDYNHAAKTFTTAPGYSNLPYQGFLFHVRLVFANTVGSDTSKAISVLIKAADLPQIKFETETLNQYNRKRIIKKRVSYDPVRIVLHDDVANTVRDLWINYNQHYLADSRYANTNTWAENNTYSVFETDRAFGLDVDRTTPFLRSLEIYNMGNQEYSMMNLMNPVISAADFDNLEYGDGAKTLALTLTVEYESLSYYTGTTNTIPGFGAENTERYDQEYSSLGLGGIEFGQPGATQFAKRENAPRLPNELSEEQMAAISRQVNEGPGKVNPTPATRFERNDYVDWKKLVAGNTENAGVTKEFNFPDALRIDQKDFLVQLNKSQSIYNAEIPRSNNISSNGKNIALANSGEGVRVTPISQSDTQASAVIAINPNQPAGLTAAEATLFARSFPPLPSTDPRAKLPPYV